MKKDIVNLFLLPALIAGLNLLPAGRVTAQTFTTLYNFTNDPRNGGGRSDLVLSGDTLYGTTHYGGGPGTVFAVKADGTGFATLYSFTDHLDGASPYAGLILSGNTLYGTVREGGATGQGAVFKINTDGTGRTTLYSFTTAAYPYYINSDGSYPIGGVILSGNTLYGTAYQGGSSGYGTVFAVNTDGTGFTTLHNFSVTSDSSYPKTNSDGANPSASLILSGNTLYGTAGTGGSSGYGTVFAVNTDGTGFTTLHTFMAMNTNSSGNYTNSDGAGPSPGFILSGNTLYGTAGAGSSGSGTVFAVNTDGTGFTTLHTFMAMNTNSSGNYTNSDGAGPRSGVILSGNTLYGTPDEGGSSGSGTLFSLSLPPPQLTIFPSGANVILTWPTNAAGFALQSTTNLVSPAIWSTVSPGPTVVNGQNAVTNPVSGSRQYFRLISN